MKIFVTGHHGSGTHALAKHLAQEYGVLYLEEGVVRGNDLDAAISLAQKAAFKVRVGEGLDFEYRADDRLKNGFAIQCPRLAHNVLELSEHGTVYWSVRNLNDLIASNRKIGSGMEAWPMMRSFRDRFPDDPIWTKLTYNAGKDDSRKGFVGYLTLLAEVKDYFYEKYFKDNAVKTQPENEPFWNSTDLRATKYPLKPKELELLNTHTGRVNEVMKA